MNVSVQRFHFEPGTLIEYDGFSVVVAGFGEAGLIVRDRYVGKDEVSKYFVLSDLKVQEILGGFDVNVDTDFSKNDPDEFNTIPNVEVPWDGRSDADKKAAFQREAWCLAAQTVLRLPPYTEKRIEERYAEIQAVAFDRQRLNDLGQIKNGEFSARSWGPKRVSDYCKVYFAAKVPHPKLLISKKLKGNTLPGLTSAQNALLDKCCQKYLSKAQPSRTAIVRMVRRVNSNMTRRKAGLKSTKLVNFE
jgi:hypothetical protein